MNLKIAEFQCIFLVILSTLNCCESCSVLGYYFLIDTTFPHCEYVKEVVEDLDSSIDFEEIFSKSRKNMSSSLSGLYRPRSALARALYEKQRNDRELMQIDKSEWYRVDFARLTPELKEKFAQLGPDRETKEFIADSIEKSSWIWTQIWYLIARLFLKYFWSNTDINGWLGRGSMFVLSEEQVRVMLGDTLGGHGGHRRSLVDVGAGDGEVTKRWAALFDTVYATEMSASMRKLLASKGFTILDVDTWYLEERKMDCVCLLNLLDRCSRPRSVVRQARAALAPGGVLVVALVLPYKPYVEATRDHKPEERFPVRGEHFEEQVASFVRLMRDEESFELVRWSRVPYLCEGDSNQAYYWLDDSVYVFRPVGNDAS